MKTFNVLRQLTGSESFVEHRKYARLDIPIKVLYKVVSGEPKAAAAKNISEGGCLLLATEKIRPNSKIELEIFLGEGESEILKLKGTIVRVNRKERGLCEYGISFSGIGNEARRLFADFCFAKMYEMIGLNQWPTDRRQK